MDKNDRVLIVGLGRKGHAVGDSPGLRFTFVHVADIWLTALFWKERKAKIKINKLPEILNNE